MTNRSALINDRLARFLVVRRLLISFIALMVIAGLGYGLGKLEFNGSYKIFFSADNLQLLAHEKIQDAYTKIDNLMFVVEPLDGKVFTKSTLASVEALTEAAWLLPYSTRVDSLSNYQHIEAIDDDLFVGDLFERAEKLNREDIQKIQAIASNEPLLVNRLLSNRNHVTAINVQLNLPYDTVLSVGLATADLVAAARKLRASIRHNNPNLRIHLQGTTILDTAFDESAQYDSTHLMPVLFFLIIGTLLLLLRSVWSALIIALVIIVSVVVTQGFMGWIGYYLNQINVMGPIIILTLAVCDCVHILASYLHHLSLGREKEPAMIEALKINLRPVFLTSITTAIGFLAMNTSDLLPFKELGNISAFGVMAAFFLSVVLLPTLAIWAPMQARPMDEKVPLWSNRLANFVIDKRTPLFWGLITVSISIASLASLNELNDENIAYFDQSTEFRQASEFTKNNLSGIDSIYYSIDSGQSGGVNNPKFLAIVEEFVAWYLSQPEVVHVQSYLLTIKRLNKILHGDDPSWYKIPESRELTAQYQLLYEMSLPYGLDLNNEIDIDKRSLLITVIVRGEKANGLLALDKRAQRWFEDNAPEIATPGSGVSLMFAHIGKTNIDSMLFGSSIALVLITITLIVVLRSFKYGLLSLLPNAFPALIAFGFWGVFVGEVDLGIAVVFSLTLGIIVDDTVHFLSKYTHARRFLNISPQDSIRYAFHTVAKPIAVTTVVLVVGFSVLMLSTFTVTVKIGIMVSATISIALIFDALLLPALLMKADGAQKNGRETSQGILLDQS